MKSQFMVYVAIAAFVLCLIPIDGTAQATIDPFGFGIAVAQEEEEVFELNLVNSFDEEIAYAIEFEWLREDENRREGPRRDDLGDRIAGYNVGNGWWTGVAWDGERMWGYDHNSGRVIAFDPEEEEVEQVFNAGFTGTTGMTYADGELWIARRQTRSIVRFNREGDNLGDIQVPVDQAIGVAWDGENCWYCGLGDQDELFLINREGELVRRIGMRDDLNDGWGTMEFVPEHVDGQLWWRDHGRSVYQMNIEGDAVEILQDFNLNAGNDFGIAHDGEYLWYTINNGTWNVIDDGVIEFGLLAVEEEEGIIPANDEAAIEIDVLPQTYEAGVYNTLIHFHLTRPEEMRDDFEETVISVSAIVSIDSPVADLAGTVTRAADDEPIENVDVVSNEYHIGRYTNGEGRYSIDELPLGVYEFAFSAEDYLPATRELEIEEEGDIELNVALLHSECAPDPDEIIHDIAPGENAELTFDVTNGGDGPLTYTVERRLLGDANADPWELRQNLHAGAELDENYVQGVVFDGENYYVTARNDDNPLIYILNRDGEPVGSFEQPGDDDRGFKDLAWDGNLIWGAGEDQDEDYIFGFTTEGEEEVRIVDPLSPSANLAWDPDREWLWISGTTTDIMAIDLEGEVQTEIDRQNLRTYGLAYYPNDEDDHNLYLFVKERDTNRPVVHKANPENGEMMQVAYLDHEEGGSPYAAFITNQFDIYSWVLMTVINNSPNDGGDRVDIWQIEARKEWFEVEPNEGVIGAEETQEFTLTLDATGLPAEVFEGELFFDHDGVGGETHLPVTLNVVEGPVHAVFPIDLAVGWNMVSSYVQPEDDDVTHICADLVEAESLIMVKDGMGRFYRPDFGFNNIPNWDVAQGYLVKMDDEGTLEIDGMTVVPDEPIDLLEGWQMRFLQKSKLNRILLKPNCKN